MSTCDEIEPIDVVEFRSDLVSEKPSCTTWADSPRFDLVRIAPDKIAKSTLVRDLLSPGNNSDLINGSDFGAETTVDTENLSIYDSRQDQKVEDLATCFPHRRIAVFLLAFFVKAIYLSNLPRLMVPSDKHNPIGISTVPISD